MSNKEEFLARWSRRKREARAADADPPAEPAQALRTEPSPAPAEPANPEVDLSSLPSIETIDAETDITVFLREGIPQELSRAALRRAWAADPAIRDFVGLAENAWDFNDPNAMAGFGSLEHPAEQVAALVQRIVGDLAQAAESVPGSPTKAAEDGARLACADDDPSEPSNGVEDSSKTVSSDTITGADHRSGFVAPQPNAQAENEEASVRHRTHGGALPR